MLPLTESLPRVVVGLIRLEKRSLVVVSHPLDPNCGTCGDSMGHGVNSTSSTETTVLPIKCRTCDRTFCAFAYRSSDPGRSTCSRRGSR
eukprot:1195532-Prorocentrum_minimum.AAC.3